MTEPSAGHCLSSTPEITFPRFHCSRKALAELFRGDPSSLEKKPRANHNCLPDTAVAKTWISMQSRRKMQVIY